MGKSSYSGDSHCVFMLMKGIQASSFDVPFDLVRVSVGLEDPEELRGRFQRALAAIKQNSTSN